jgi:uncharacterized membrane protein
MGLIFRLPFYITAIFIWTFVGGVISFVNLFTLPVSILVSLIFPSYRNNVKDIVKLGILLRGYKRINYFLKFGF